MKALEPKMPIAAEIERYRSFEMKKYGSMWVHVVTALLLASPISCLSQDTQLSARPPMGWNSWNHFGEAVTDRDIRNTADVLVSSGMRDAGYVYVNIDDTWQGKRDALGSLQPNQRFPDMKALAAYVHSRGLKLGIYSSPGPKTCAGYEGSYGHEQQDAKQYATWGIDYLKYDLCGLEDVMKAKAPTDQHARNEIMRDAYLKMDKALRASGRPIVYSLCQYGRDSVWTWGASVGGNLWRTTADIKDNYQSMSENGFVQAGLERYAHPGAWNDPDMLEIGNGGMNADEYKTHMSLWAMLAAPLLAGNDLTKMDKESRAILMNRDAIGIDQDPLGKQGDRLAAAGPFEIWTRPLSGERVAVALFNRGEDIAPMNLPSPSQLGLGSVHSIENVWDPEHRTGPWSAPQHGVVLLIVK